MAAGVATISGRWDQILLDDRLASRPRRVTRTINSGMHAAARTCKTTEHGSLWGFAKRELAEMCKNGTVRAPLEHHHSKLSLSWRPERVRTQRQTSLLV